MKSLVLAVALSLNAATAAHAVEDLAGYDTFPVKAAHRAAPLAGSIWYPVATPTYRGLIGDNALFVGRSAYVGAAPRPGQYPLVVLSHGSGGNMDGLSWLSSELAKRGALVVAVNHPGSTSGDSSPRRTVLPADRAADISAALDSVLANPAFAPLIDKSHIVSLGFSLGGATALHVAGVTMDAARYKAYCNRFGAEAHDCVFLAKGGVDLAHLPDQWEAKMRDARVSAAIAVDPGFSHAMNDDSLKALNLPVLLINLGGEERWPAANLGPKGSNLVARLPGADYAVFQPANHFTFLAECKPGGRELLIAEGEDPICDEPAGTDRRKVHEGIIARVAAFLGLK